MKTILTIGANRGIGLELANLLPKQSVEKIQQLLNSVSFKDSGKFFHYNAQELP
jgi:hypothetical protein